MVHVSQLDGKSVAVVLNLSGREVLCRGRGVYQTDTTLGRVLRISIEPNEADGQLEFLIQEALWDGTIVDGASYQCDYAMELTLLAEKATSLTTL